MTKKNGLKLFETKTTTLKWGVNIIKVDVTDNAQLDLLTAVLEQRLSDGWIIEATDTAGNLLIYTLVFDFREYTDTEPWRGQD